MVEKRNIAIVLLVVAIIFLALSVVFLYSFTNLLGSSLSFKKSNSQQDSAAQVKIFVEGNEFSEVGK